MAQGLNTPIPTLAQAQAQKYSERELTYIRQQRARAVIGDPREVRERLLQLRGEFEADELMLLTITGDYESRLHSYELIGREFDLA
jgi:alkanesulfonate monooxygenase SsuD/methylene tetrahydromethanopterin reductase-like flavin-dependent oxidoreductase (luciferase family)